jgi:hypothetical protein
MFVFWLYKFPWNIKPLQRHFRTYGDSHGSCHYGLKDNCVGSSTLCCPPGVSWALTWVVARSQNGEVLSSSKFYPTFLLADDGEKNKINGYMLYAIPPCTVPQLVAFWFLRSSMTISIANINAQYHYSVTHHAEQLYPNEYRTLFNHSEPRC